MKKSKRKVQRRPTLRRSRFLKGRQLTPEQEQAQRERQRWWRWQDVFDKAIASLIQHKPNMPGLVKHAERIADGALKTIERRMPRSVRDG